GGPPPGRAAQLVLLLPRDPARLDVDPRRPAVAARRWAPRYARTREPPPGPGPDPPTVGLRGRLPPRHRARPPRGAARAGYARMGRDRDRGRPHHRGRGGRRLLDRAERGAGGGRGRGRQLRPRREFTG